MILIKNGLLIDPSSQKEGEFDLLISDGIVKDVQPKGKIVCDAKIYDASNKWVMPGFIDLNVHLREPGFEKKETIATGTKAALAGGFTSICCMPDTNPVNDSLQVTNYILQKAKEANNAKVFPIGALSVGLEDNDLSPLSKLYNAGCVAFSNDSFPIKSAAMMRRALDWCAMLGVRIHCHEEDLSLCGVMNESPLSLCLGLSGSPSISEEIMIARDIELARYTKGKIHICHVSTARSAKLISRAKADGIDVTAEVTPHHLFLTQDEVSGYNTLCKVFPPLRLKEDSDALFNALLDGTIDVVVSCHSPQDSDSKNTVFDLASFGLIGLQSTVSLLIKCVLDGKMTKKRFVEVLSKRPAEIINKNLGSLQIGKAADICIIDPHKTWKYTKETIFSKSYNTPFLNKELQGKVEAVFVDGIQKKL